LYTKQLIARIAKLLNSRRALATPVTYLILFASLISLISVTYSFAVTKIGSQNATVETSIAKQNMQVLDDAVHSVLWTPGATSVIYMDNAGGTFGIVPNTPRLILNLTDEHTSSSSIIFNSTIGQTLYSMQPSESDQDGFYLRGDERAIINQSAYTLTQLYFAAGNNSKNLILSYRPSATVAVVGSKEEQPLNLIRVNIVNLSSSQSLLLYGEFYLEISSVSVTNNIDNYIFNESISSLAMTSTLNGVQTTVHLPISSNAAGAAVELEIVVCNIKIQEAEA